MTPCCSPSFIMRAPIFFDGSKFFALARSSTSSTAATMPTPRTSPASGWPAKRSWSCACM
jgi:hypothetical protein